MKIQMQNEVHVPFIPQDGMRFKVHNKWHEHNYIIIDLYQKQDGDFRLLCLGNNDYHREFNFSELIKKDAEFY